MEQREHDSLEILSNSPDLISMFIQIRNKISFHYFFAPFTQIRTRLDPSKVFDISLAKMSYIFLEARKSWHLDKISSLIYPEPALNIHEKSLCHGHEFSLELTVSSSFNDCECHETVNKYFLIGNVHFPALIKFFCIGSFFIPFSIEQMFAKVH